MAYDIFISYRRDGGKELARPLKSELERRSYRVFLDFDELKDGIFDRRIMEAIDAAPIFVVILSPHALDRCVEEDDWVRREIEYALEHDRHFIPVNPDQLFEGFPAKLPETMKTGLGQHQFSEVMFGQLFMASVDKMIEDRIKPILSKTGRTTSQEQVGALFHIETDTECRILKFGKEIAVARPDDDTTIRLRKGRHKLEIVSTECPDDRLSLLQTVEDNDMEDILTIELAPLREKWLAALRAEEERRKSEERDRLRRQEAERRNRAIIAAEKGKEAYAAGDNAEAVRLWSEAAAAGIPAAQSNLGDCYYEGHGVATDYDAAVAWYRKAAEQEDAGGQYGLGRCYGYGRGVKINIDESLKWHRKAAEQGHVQAQWALAFHYIGYHNDAEAVKWLRTAAEKGHSIAQYRLGEYYEQGKGGLAKDYAEAAKWYLRAAEQDELWALGAIGDCYYYGRGVQENDAEAVKWYRRAADQGLITLRELGDCYLFGRGVSQNYAEAVKCYFKAADSAKYAYAQFRLGYCYYNGYGVAQDYAEAVKWYEKAAKNGIVSAQHNLAICYEYGRGVAKDLATAKELYRKAAAGGIENAKKALARLGE